VKQDGAVVAAYEESVRLYLTTLLAEAGLSAEQRFGDLAGGAWREDSPRLILAGTKV